MEKSLDTYLSQNIPIKAELNIILAGVENPIIFDIGACECEDSIRYKRQFPSARVFSFEPLESNYQKCLENIRKYSVDIQIQNVALSNENGVTEFFVSSGRPAEASDPEWDYGNKSSSILKPKNLSTHAWLKFNKTDKVTTITLDDFCLNNNITYIDYIHMDVQGAELMVLQGSSKMLANVKSIWLEVSNVELYEGQPLKATVEEYLNQRGFVKVKDTVTESGDQLYINSAFFKKSIFKIKLLLNKIVKTVFSEDQGTDIATENKNLLLNHFDELQLYIPEDRAWAFSNEGYYEHNVEFWLKTISNRYRDELKNTAFMDIGANIGYYSLLLSKLFSKIYAFEPVSSTGNILKKNIVLSRSTNISHLNYALSDNAGNQQINLYDNSGQNSLVRRKDVEGQYIQCAGIQSVELVSLDGISKDMNLLKPGLMKIDVEGFEINVLKGARNTIEDAKPIIIFEFSSNTSKDASYTKEDILHLEFLRSNYSFLGLSEDYNDNILHTTLDSKIANIVAIPNHMIEKYKEDFKDLISL